MVLNNQSKKMLNFSHLPIYYATNFIMQVAAFVISKVLMYEEGQRYCGTFPERFYAISNVLAKALDQYPGKPPMQLLKHILTCFKRLTEVYRLVG